MNTLPLTVVCNRSECMCQWIAYVPADNMHDQVDATCPQCGAPLTVTYHVGARVVWVRPRYGVVPALVPLSAPGME